MTHDGKLSVIEKQARLIQKEESYVCDMGEIEGRESDPITEKLYYASCLWTR